MNANLILKFAETFVSLASEINKVKDLINYVKNIDEKIDIANYYYEKIAEGSSRIVYLTDNDTVIKIAKNDKGIAQNKAELLVKDNCKYINAVIDSDGKYWLEAKYLKQLNSSDFEKLVGISFYKFSKCLNFALNEVSDSNHPKPDYLDEVKDLDIFKELVKIGKKYKIMPGDMIRISSYCQSNGYPVLIDFGMTKDVFYKYYD